MTFLINLILSGAALYLTAWLLPGTEITSFGTAIVVAIVLGFINAFIRPVLSFFALPITFLTLGLFSFVITTVLLLLTQSLIDGFVINGFISAAIFGLVLSFVQGIVFTFKK